MQEQAWDEFAPNPSRVPYSSDQFYTGVGADRDHARSVRTDLVRSGQMRVSTSGRDLISNIVADFPIYKTAGDYLRDAHYHRAHALGGHEDCPPELQIKLREFAANAQAQIVVARMEYYEEAFEHWSFALDKARTSDQKRDVAKQILEAAEDTLDPYWATQMKRLAQDV